MSNLSPDRKSKEQVKDYAYLNTPLPSGAKSLFYPTEAGIQPTLIAIPKDEAGNIIARPVFIVDPISAQLAGANTVFSGAGIAGPVTGARMLNVYAFQVLQRLNGGSGNVMWVADTNTGFSAIATGGTIIAAATGKYRVFGILIGNTTAGLITVGELNLNVLVPANGSIYVPMGNNGMLQNTTATAITATGPGAPAAMSGIIFTDNGAN